MHLCVYIWVIHTSSPHSHSRSTLQSFVATRSGKQLIFTATLSCVGTQQHWNSASGDFSHFSFPFTKNIFKPLFSKSSSVLLVTCDACVLYYDSGAVRLCERLCFPGLTEEPFINFPVEIYLQSSSGLVTHGSNLKTGLSDWVWRVNP